MEAAATIPKKQFDAEVERLKNLYKPNNAFSVNTTSHLDFFKWWCVFLRPFINLTDRERDVVAGYLNRRYEFSKKVKDQALLDTMMASSEVRDMVIQDCGLTKPHFFVVLSSLKKKGVVVGNTINSRLIPSIKEDDNGVFKLMILFKDSAKTA